jgi:GPH family glycoside/pentoside/hexuronide:cation symporter
MEMTADYHERTRLFSSKSFFGNVGAILTPWLYAAANWPVFMGEGGDEVDGMRRVSYVAAAVVIVVAVVCAVFCRERVFDQVRTQKRQTVREGLAVTSRNRTFLVLVGIVLATVLGFNLVNNFANYIQIFYLFEGDKRAGSALMGWVGTAWAVTAVIAVFPLNWVSRRIGKTRAMAVSVGLMVGAQASKIWCYNPELPWLVLIPTVMLSMGMVMFFTLASAMVADVCDEDELKTGTRKEGAYYSVFWWFMKMGMAGAYLAAGVLLVVSGFDRWKSRVDVSESVLTWPFKPYGYDRGLERFWKPASTVDGWESVTLWMRVIEIGVPILLCVVSFVLIRKYPLSEARAYEVKRALEARKSGRG